VRKAFARSRAPGIDTTVFGSGPARTAPSGFPREAGEYAYSGFFESLRKTSHPGRISIEAKTQNLPADAPKAVAFLRQAAAP
jgi:hypothetical protein